MNEVVITALPHPITTFVLGIMVVFSVVTMIYLNRVLNRLQKVEKDNESVIEKLSNHFKATEKMNQEISRKVDSRIDKALNNINK